MIPFFHWQRAATLAFEAQWVVALRMMRLMQGGPRADIEARRMVSEKFAALAASQMAAVAAVASGASMAQIAARAMVPVSTRVTANRRRLSRRPFG